MANQPPIQKRTTNASFSGLLNNVFNIGLRPQSGQRDPLEESQEEEGVDLGATGGTHIIKEENKSNLSTPKATEGDNRDRPNGQTGEVETVNSNEQQAARSSYSK